MNFDNIEFDIKIIHNFFYHKVLKVNKIDKKYNNICEIIIVNKEKFKDIIFNKCVIINEILYYKNRL